MLRIRTKVLLLMLFVALAPLLGLWAYSYETQVEDLRQSAELRLSASADSLSSRVEQWLDTNTRMLSQMTQTAEIQSMDTPTQNRLLATITKEYPWSYLAFTTNPYGKNVGRSDGKGLKDYSDRSYIKQILEGYPIGKQVLIGKTSGKPALVLSKGIMTQDNRLKGILAIAMKLDDISRVVTSATFGKTGRAFLLDDKGKVVAHANAEMTKKQEDLSSHPAFVATQSGQSNGLVYRNEDGIEVHAATAKTAQGWVLVAEQASADILSPVKSATLVMAIIFGVSAIIVIALALVFSNRMTAPIREITLIAEEVSSKAKFDRKIPGMDRGDELGELARSFERMRSSLKIAFRKLRS